MKIVRCLVRNAPFWNSSTGIGVGQRSCSLSFKDGVADIPYGWDTDEFTSALEREYGDMFSVQDDVADEPKHIAEMVDVADWPNVEVAKEIPLVPTGIDDSNDIIFVGSQDKKPSIVDLIKDAKCSSVDQVLNVLLDNGYLPNSDTLLADLMNLRDLDRLDALVGKTDSLLRVRVGVVLKKRTGNIG